MTCTDVAQGHPPEVVDEQVELERREFPQAASEASGLRMALSALSFRCLTIVQPSSGAGWCSERGAGYLAGVLELRQVLPLRGVALAISL
jgi:hypothetical protein